MVGPLTSDGVDVLGEDLASGLEVRVHLGDLRPRRRTVHGAVAHIATRQPARLLSYFVSPISVMRIKSERSGELSVVGGDFVGDDGAEVRLHPVGQGAGNNSDVNRAKRGNEGTSE